MRLDKRQAYYYYIEQREKSRKRYPPVFHCFVKLNKRSGYSIYSFSCDQKDHKKKWRHIGYFDNLPEDPDFPKRWASIHHKTTKEYVDLQLSFI